MRLTWDLLDFYDRASGATSMSRTTAMPCTAMARLVASGAFDQRGVIVPELVGRTSGMLDRVLGMLKERGIVYHAAVTARD